MNKTPAFGHYDEHRPQFVLALLLTFLLVAFLSAMAGCLTPAGQRKLIDTVNEAQFAAAQTYDTAKAVQADAQTRCAAALRAAAKPLPATPGEIRPACAAVGSPVPYDPTRLQQAAGSVNALYDAVRAANALRVSAGGDAPANVLGALVGTFEQVVADLAAAGVSVPKVVTDAIQTVKAATGGPK